MSTTAPSPPASDPLAAIRRMTLAEVETRLVELDGERAALSLLRRSLIARDRARGRATRRLPSLRPGASTPPRKK